MNIFAVILTYSDRFNLYIRVVDKLLIQGVYKVILVDNNSAERSKRKLKGLKKQLGHRLEILWLDSNKGSATGYKRGIEAACNDKECDLIWLLDDDNIPMDRALQVCLSFWKNNKMDNKRASSCLASYRIDRPWHKYAILKNRPTYVIGPMNSFMRFHLFWTALYFIEKLGEYIISTKNDHMDTGTIAVAPYGGLFFHKQLISKIGLPREDFYLYVDDNEFSYRISRHGGKIILLLDSKIEDIDKSWDTGKKVSFFKILSDGEHYRVYYSIRNRTYFELNERVGNRFIYDLNRLSWVIIVYFISLVIGRQKRMKLILKAIRDGLNEKLGKIDSDMMKI